MVWDISTPVGTENKILGDDRIREGKSATQTALQVEGVFPGPDTTNPVYIPIIKSGTTAQRLASNPTYTGRWYWNTDTKTIQRDNGVSWDDLTFPINNMPAGTGMIFYQAASPTGWTQVTTAAINDSLLRVVSGSTGGTSTAGQSVSSPPTHDHSGTGSVPSDGTNHSHTLTITNALSFVSQLTNIAVWAVGQIANPTSIPHVHTVPAVAGFSPKYQDIIVCTKN